MIKISRTQIQRRRVLYYHRKDNNSYGPILNIFNVVRGYETSLREEVTGFLEELVRIEDSTE